MHLFWSVCDFKKGEGMGKKDLSTYACAVFMGNQKGVVGERCAGEPSSARSPACPALPCPACLARRRDVRLPGPERPQGTPAPRAQHPARQERCED